MSNIITYLKGSKSLRWINKYYYLMTFSITILFVIGCCLTMTYANEEKEYSDAQKEFFEEIYDHMTARDEEFDVSYRDNNMEWNVDDIYYILAQIDSDSTYDDYDYLRGNISQIDCVSKHSAVNGTTVSFKIEWLESKEQTKTVKKKIDEIIEMYDVDHMSDYDKIKFVHDYIVKNVSYDKSERYFSAYEGLIGGETVCQGFSLLTYRMLTQAGVRCRYVVGKYVPEGKTEGENHAWNLVKLGDRWYYLDNTWDACSYQQSGTEESQTRYFLKGSNSFEKEHIADEIENGSDIANLYNISTVDYSVGLNNGYNDNQDDLAVTPHEFFRKKGDGTGKARSKVVAFFDKLYIFIATRMVELVATLVIIVIIVVVIKKQSQNI